MNLFLKEQLSSKMAQACLRSQLPNRLGILSHVIVLLIELFLFSNQIDKSFNSNNDDFIGLNLKNNFLLCDWGYSKEYILKGFSVNI